MKEIIIRKLTSRKLWLAVAMFISGLITAFGGAFLAAARSRFGSDNSQDCHSLPHRRFALLHYLKENPYLICRQRRHHNSAFLLLHSAFKMPMAFYLSS